MVEHIEDEVNCMYGRPYKPYNPTRAGVFWTIMLGFVWWVLCGFGICFFLPILYGYDKNLWHLVPGCLLVVGGIVLFKYARKRCREEEEKGEAISQEEREKREAQEKEWRAQREARERERRERILTSPIRELSPLEFEEYTAQYLRDRGYKKVRLTPKTGDYGADILAVTPDNKKICVQCKRYSNPVGIQAVQEINAAKTHYRCEIAAIAVTSKGFTKQAKVLAKDVNVLLYAYDDYRREFCLQ